jgi:hypothetical protein
LRAARPRATRSHDPPSLITGGAVAGPRRLSWRSAAHPPPPPTPPPTPHPHPPPHPPPTPPPTHPPPHPPPQLILDLIKIRTSNGIGSRAKVTVRKAVADVYAATIDDKVGAGEGGCFRGGG